jgi:polyisoprenyl-teichoic acid--peptidoglycan teichoic acid transferase
LPNGVIISRMSQRRRPISPLEFILATVIIGLGILVGFQLLLGSSAPANTAGPIIVQVLPSPTSTRRPTVTPIPPPEQIIFPTQVFPATWTSTPTWTPTATRTDTPIPTPTSKPPLQGLRPTVTAAFTDIFTDTPVPTPVPLIDLPPDTINIALLGSDARPNVGGWRTDVIIIVSINPDVPSVSMFSIPRDTWVYIPNWQYTRVNIADEHGEFVKFPGGGPGLVEQTIQYNFGIPVQYYARVDFEGYKKLIDSVGGVDVVADCPLYDIFPDVPAGSNDIISDPSQLATVLTGTIDIPTPGIYHLDGKHALWYARSRKTTSDFDRSRRQQHVLNALWSKIREQGLINKLPDIWSDVVSTVQTDLSLNDVIYLANLGQTIDRSRIRSSFLDGAYAHRFTSIEGASVFSYTYDEISNTIQTAFSPPIIGRAVQPPATIEVFNGTPNQDWDAIAADRLSSAGYHVVSYGPADRADYPTTAITDLRATSKGSRLSELSRLFNTRTAVYQSDPNAPAEYRIILGADFQPCLRANIGTFTRPPTATPTPNP